MPAADILENDFIDFAEKPLYYLLHEYKSNVPSFQKVLRQKTYRFRGELIKDIEGKIIDHTNCDMVFENFRAKMNRLIEDRFYVDDNVLFYKCDTFRSRINEHGTEMHRFAFNLHVYCQEILTIVNREQTKYISSIRNEDPSGEAINHIAANNQSFILRNPKRVNLNSVHKILQDERFIKNTNFDTFASAFSGKPMDTKIIWPNANSLRYFIRSIYGVGVVKPNEGKWQRTIKCFKRKEDIEYNVENFKNTKSPTARVTLKLQTAIDRMNK
jgi:hypothetical protein